MPDYNLEGPKWGSSTLGTTGGVVTWAIDATIPASFVPVLTAAFSDWAAHANIQFQQVASTTNSLIDIGLRAIDGLNGTLGVTDYTYSQASLISAAISFDTGEGWHSSGNSIVSNGGANFFATALHEIGHAIGLDHYNSAPAIMNAVITSAVTDLTGSDIDGVHALYGSSPAQPTPSVETNLFGTIAHDSHSTTGEIYALYEGLLNRAPDLLGGESWAAAFASGASLLDITQGFLASDEARTHLNAVDNAGFVEQLYETVLGRHGDAAGAQSWVNALAAGTSRADVADGFVFSSEHVGQLQGSYNSGVFIADPSGADIARLYYGLLGRAPDAGGLQLWEDAAHSGVKMSTIAQGFIDSAEYSALHGHQTDAQFIEGLYTNELGRPPDTLGEQSWLSTLEHGASRADVAVGFADSAEAKSHLVSHIEHGWLLA